MGPENLRIHSKPTLNNATLLLGFSGWMDGGEVSTGTIQYLIQKFDAELVADIDPEPFYIYSFPGDMDVSALFRPYTRIDDGMIREYDGPESQFYCVPDLNLVLFIGKEPNLGWRPYGDCVFSLCKDLSITRAFFIGSVAGVTPHTREPRIAFSASDQNMRDYLQKLGLRPSTYEGPASFLTYLTNRAAGEGIGMANLVAEIPAYVQGYNPHCIETTTRLVGRLMDLQIQVDDLHTEAAEFDKKIQELVNEQSELAEKVKELERDYDNEAFDHDMADLKTWLAQQGIRVD